MSSCFLSEFLDQGKAAFPVPVFASFAELAGPRFLGCILCSSTCYLRVVVSSRVTGQQRTSVNSHSCYCTTGLCVPTSTAPQGHMPHYSYLHLSIVSKSTCFCYYNMQSVGLVPFAPKNSTSVLKLFYVVFPEQKL